MGRHPTFPGPAIQTIITAKDGSNFPNPPLRVRVNGARNMVSLAAIRIEKASLLACRWIDRDFGRTPPEFTGARPPFPGPIIQTITTAN